MKKTGNYVSILLVTYNRFPLFEKCFNAIINKIRHPFELLIWNNGSTDNTASFINNLSLNNLKQKNKFIQDFYGINFHTNIGCNAFCLLARLATGTHFLEIDDDVIDLPDRDFIYLMLKAFHKDKLLGFLALDVVQNEHTNGGIWADYQYTEKNYEDFVIKYGPVGGWCSMIPRTVYDKVGEFIYLKDRIYFFEDGNYIKRLEQNHLRAGILKDVKCFHAAGPYYNDFCPEVWNNKYIDMEKHEKLKRKAWKFKDIKKRQEPIIPINIETETRKEVKCIQKEEDLLVNQVKKIETNQGTEQKEYSKVLYFLGRIPIFKYTESYKEFKT